MPKERVDYQLALLAMPVLLVLDLACLVGLLFAPLPGVTTARRTFAVAVAVLLAIIFGVYIVISKRKLGSNPLQNRSDRSREET